MITGLLCILVFDIFDIVIAFCLLRVYGILDCKHVTSPTYFIFVRLTKIVNLSQEPKLYIYLSQLINIFVCN